MIARPSYSVQYLGMEGTWHLLVAGRWATAAYPSPDGDAANWSKFGDGRCAPARQSRHCILAEVEAPNASVELRNRRTETGCGCRSKSGRIEKRREHRREDECFWGRGGANHLFQACLCVNEGTHLRATLIYAVDGSQGRKARICVCAVIWVCIREGNEEEKCI